MNTRLYVGNLSFNTTADGVRTAFEQFGTVTDVHLVTDRETGRARGFAFVTMGTPDEAAKAMQSMDGQTLDGRPLRVNEAEQRQQRGGGGGGGGGTAAVAVAVVAAVATGVVVAAVAATIAAVAVVVAAAVAAAAAAAADRW